jgi:hypothetical protein
VEKGWNNLKIHFTRAQKTYHLSKPIAIRAGYNMANAATTEFQQDIVEAIANLANASATDKGMIDTLTNANATLTAQLAALSEQVRHLNTTNQAPTGAPNAHVPGPATWVQQGRGRGIGAGRGKDTLPDNGNYCWSHGHHVTNAHTSLTCNYPYEGHKRESTRHNTMGCSTKNKDSMARG